MRRAIRFALFLAVLSIAAIVVRALGYPASVPRFLTQTLDWYVEPGLTVWWCTLGGLFEGFPSDRPGYAVTVLGNVAFWLSMGYVAQRVLGAIRARVTTRGRR